MKKDLTNPLPDMSMFQGARVPEIDIIEGDHMILNMGPQHPSTHGVLRLELLTDGEVCVKVTPHIGYLHRCFEKIAESVPYNQVIPYTDRLDYLASMNNNLGFALAVEKLIGIEVNERVKTIRVIMAELNRIASHLVAFGTYALDLGAFTPFLYAFRERERIIDLFEEVCGARLLYNYIWIGGLSHDLPDGWAEKCRDFCDYFLPKIDEYNNLFSFNQIFIDRTAEVGIMNAQQAIAYGATGPNLRGAGITWDLRKTEPYSGYEDYDFDICIGSGEKGIVGDCWDRYMVRIREMEQSVRIIRQALDRLPEGNVQEAIPKSFKKIPEGEVYMRTEAPRGELGYYVISDGSQIPYRVKCRSNCFTSLSAVPEIGVGAMIADIVAIIGSIDIVLGEVDR
ncbi:MAG: NADH-quinone oxidoreductase subunit D [bacterium]